MRVETLAADLHRVTGIQPGATATDPLLVIEQRGTVRLLDDDAILDGFFLDLRDRVLSTGFEQGLTGLALAPDFPQDPRVYANYTRLDGASVISRFGLLPGDPLQADASSEEVLIVVPQPHPTHNCSQLAFGADGMLYIGCGDGGSGNGPILDPRFLGHHLGKLLRIDVNPATGYAIPPDNPFLARGSALPEIWATGLRNPYRFSFDEVNGDLWLGDVGQSTWEEINHVPAASGGINFGWPILEGSHCWPAGSACDATGLRLPLHEYQHTQGRCAVIGGMRLHGASDPILEGIYLYADFCSAEIFGLRESSDGKFAAERLAQANGHLLTTIGRTHQGDVLLGTYGFGNAHVLRLLRNTMIFASGLEPSETRSNASDGEIRSGFSHIHQ